MEASKQFEGRVEILDLRSINPLDMEAISASVEKHGKVLLVTEESVEASFTLGLAGRIQRDCFQSLDAPIGLVGAIDTPAIPLNSTLEAELLPNADKVHAALNRLLNY